MNSVSVGLSRLKTPSKIAKVNIQPVFYLLALPPPPQWQRFSTYFFLFKADKPFLSFLPNQMLWLRGDLQWMGLLDAAILLQDF